MHIDFLRLLFELVSMICSVLLPKRSAMMIDGSENTNVSWLLNFRIRMFLKSTVNVLYKFIT